MRGKLSKQVKRELVEAFGSRCMLTGDPLEFHELTYHHLVKACHGGQEDFENGVLLSARAHRYLHNEIEKSGDTVYDETERRQVSLFYEIQLALACYKSLLILREKSLENPNPEVVEAIRIFEEEVVTRYKEEVNSKQK